MQKTAEITEDSMLMASNTAHFFFSFFCLVHKYFFRITECHSLPLLPRPRPSPPQIHPPSPALPLQICVGKNEDLDGFLRLSSGKRRGLVPVKCLLEI